ncbi:MAG: hypothetical protein J7L16_01810, partial [Deltaproteobacteria bacterium]|nr:hypothetical protein [Deltaproteobacteria bacterium]
MTFCRHILKKAAGHFGKNHIRVLTRNPTQLFIAEALTGTYYLKPASVEFAEDLPAAGRCKAARAQTYYDT